MEKFTKFQSIYKEITGDNINWEEIPENLREVFLNSSQLNAQEVAKLPFNIRVAYLIANKPPDNVILEKIKKQLTFYEGKYGMSSEDFYRKYHNSESLFDRIKDQLARYEHWVTHLTELDSMEMEALLLLRDEIEENMWRLSNPFMEWKENLRRVDNELQQQAALCFIKLDGYFVNKTNPPSSAWWWHLFDTSNKADADSFGGLEPIRKVGEA